MRTILLMLLLAIGLSLNAQTHYLQSIKVATVANAEVTEIDAKVKITINFDTKQCVVYNQYIQIINFIFIREYTDSDGFEVTETVGRNQDGTSLNLKLYTHPTRNQVVVAIEYGDAVIIYDCFVRTPF